jgi:hypothetical protein
MLLSTTIGGGFCWRFCWRGLSFPLSNSRAKGGGIAILLQILPCLVLHPCLFVSNNIVVAAHQIFVRTNDRYPCSYMKLSCPKHTSIFFSRAHSVLTLVAFGHPCSCSQAAPPVALNHKVLHGYPIFLKGATIYHPQQTIDVAGRSLCNATAPPYENTATFQAL